MGRKSNQDQMRIRIMEALDACLQDKPFDQTTIKDIARAAGINHGLLHYYFKNKEDILVHYIDFVLGHYKTMFESLAGEEEARGLDEKQLLVWLFQAVGQGITLNRRLSQVFIEIWEIAVYNPTIREKLRRLYREWIAVVNGFVGRVVPDPGTARRMSTAVVAFLEGVSLFSILLDAEELELEEVLHDFQQKIPRILLG